MTSIFVGLDDTDTLDAPGTNQLARHLAYELAPVWNTHLITRHQLLEDPRVPYTKRNGCVAIAIEPMRNGTLSDLQATITSIMYSWCPEGSDPGLCLAAGPIADEIIEFGRHCQRELTTQQQARDLAERQGIVLAGLGGTEDGVIGALSAVGLMATSNDGRVIYLGAAEVDHFDVSGVYPVSRLVEYGIDEIRRLDNEQLVSTGNVALGKRLRPNLRHGKVVLFVSPSPHAGVDWLAERVV